MSDEKKLSKMFREEILNYILKCRANVSFFTGHEMSGKISKCPVRDPWFAGQNVWRSSKWFRVLWSCKWQTFITVQPGKVEEGDLTTPFIIIIMAISWFAVIPTWLVIITLGALIFHRSLVLSCVTGSNGWWPCWTYIWPLCTDLQAVLQWCNLSITFFQVFLE